MHHYTRQYLFILTQMELNPGQESGSSISECDQALQEPPSMHWNKVLMLMQSGLNIAGMRMLVKRHLRADRLQRIFWSSLDYPGRELGTWEGEKVANTDT